MSSPYQLNIQRLLRLRRCPNPPVSVSIIQGKARYIVDVRCIILQSMLFCEPGRQFYPFDTNREWRRLYGQKFRRRLGARAWARGSLLHVRRRAYLHGQLVSRIRRVGTRPGCRPKAQQWAARKAVGGEVREVLHPFLHGSNVYDMKTVPSTHF